MVFNHHHAETDQMDLECEKWPSPRSGPEKENKIRGDNFQTHDEVLLPQLEK